MSSINVEAAVRSFVEATGAEATIQLLDVAYDELVAALDWGDPAIVAKQGADLVYLIVASLVERGIPFNEVFAAVHTSNMTRGTETDESGRVVQGPSYVDPNKAIREILGK